MAPFLKTDLALSAGEVGLLVAAMSLGRVIASFPAGRLLDEVGDRAIMIWGGVGMACCFTIAALSRGPWSVGAALACAGMCAGAATPAGAKSILRAFPRGRRGMPMGVRQSAVPLGGLIAALSLPPMAERFGWSRALLVAGLVPLIGVAAAVLGTDRGSVAERRPLEAAPFRLLVRSPGVLPGIAWGALFATGQFTLLTYLILYLMTDLGYSTARAAFVLGTVQAAGMGARVLWGFTTDRLSAGRLKPSIITINVMGLGSAALLMVAQELPALPFVLAVATLAGASLVGWQGVWISLLSELVPRHVSGRTLGFGLTFLNVSVLVWPPILGLAADLTGTYQATWGGLNVVLAVCLVLALRLSEPRVSGNVAV